MSEQEAQYQMSVRVVWVAVVLSLVVVGLMVWNYVGRVGKDPLESREFHELKQELTKTLKDESRPLKERQGRLDELQTQIRDLDLQLRQTYFAQRRFAALGGGLLVLFVAVGLLAARWAMTVRRKLPRPVAQPSGVDPELGIQRIGRWAVAALGGALTALAVMLALGFDTRLPADGKDGAGALAQASSAASVTSAGGTTAATTATSGKPDAAATDPAAPGVASAATVAAPSGAAAKEAAYPSEEEMAANWPRFRGHGGMGICTQTEIPTTWNAAEGTNILWKTAIALPGNNSPIVWGQRIFLSGADEESRKVYCVSVDDGKLLWEAEVPITPQSPKKPPKISDETGFAAPSMATDGRRVFAIFANGDLAAFDFDGKLVWNQSFGLFNSPYGYAASLCTHKQLVLVQIDHGESREGLSRMLGLDGATGKAVWDTPRPVPASWTSPVVARLADREQLITCADPWVIAYNPDDGKELWRAKCLKQDVGPSPVCAHGMVYAANEFPCLTAIKADGEGDVTKTHVAWTGEDGLPDTCSPLVTDKYLLLLASAGTLTCYEAKEGKHLWEHDFDSAFKASPTLVGKYVYLIGDEGKAWVVELGEEDCREVGTAELGENCTASPAFAPGKMFLRGAEHLYCVGKKP